MNDENGEIEVVELGGKFSFDGDVPAGAVLARAVKRGADMMLRACEVDDFSLYVHALVFIRSLLDPVEDDDGEGLSTAMRRALFPHVFERDRMQTLAVGQAVRELIRSAGMEPPEDRGYLVIDAELEAPFITECGQYLMTDAHFAKCDGLMAAVLEHDGDIETYRHKMAHMAEHYTADAREALRAHDNGSN